MQSWRRQRQWLGWKGRIELAPTGRHSRQQLALAVAAISTAERKAGRKELVTNVAGARDASVGNPSSGTRNPPLSFFSLLSTLSPSSSLWLTSLTAGLTVDLSLSLRFHASLTAVSDLSSSQALSLSVTIASSSSCLGCQRFLCRGSIPWWQLLRGSVERSSANGSLLYLPLFLPVKVSKESSYSSDDSDEEEEKPSKTPQKSAKDVEMVDADSAKKVSKTPSTPSVATGGSKTLFVGNLSFSLQRSDFEEFFKDCGEVVDVRFSVDDTGRFKRFRHVEFAIAKAAQSALELNEHELLNHHVRLDLARERGSYILVAV
ncbi:hypothetical protein AHAS_Ahas13G0429500 [Arachis hypogaea]